MGSVRPPNLCLFLNYLLHFTPSTNKQNVLQEMPIVRRNVKRSVDSSKWIFCYPLFLFFFQNPIFYISRYEFSISSVWLFTFQYLIFDIPVQFSILVRLPQLQKVVLANMKKHKWAKFYRYKKDRPKMVGQFDKTGQIMVKYWYQTKNHFKVVTYQVVWKYSLEKATYCAN